MPNHLFPFQVPGSSYHSLWKPSMVSLRAVARDDGACGIALGPESVAGRSRQPKPKSRIPARTHWPWVREFDLRAMLDNGVLNFGIEPNGVASFSVKRRFR